MKTIKKFKYGVKSFYKKIVFQLSATNHPIIKWYYHSIYQPKPNTLSAYLDAYSKQNPQLYFIQIGGNDGINNDPFHKFIKRDKWQGIILEPQSYVFEQYLKRLYANDSKINTIKAALGNNNGNQILYKIGFSNERWATGLASFERAILEKAYVTGHVLRQAKKQGFKMPKDNTKWIIEEQVKVISWEKLLTLYPYSSIDLVAIDTEGYDFEIIKLIDFQTLKPKLIVFEDIHLSQKDAISCSYYLMNRGYKIENYGGNVVAYLYSDFE